MGPQYLFLEATPTGPVGDNWTAPELRLIERFDPKTWVRKYSHIERLPNRSEGPARLFLNDGPLSAALSDAFERPVRRVIFLVHGFEYEPRRANKAGDPFPAIFHWGDPIRHNGCIPEEWNAPEPNEDWEHRTPWLRRLQAGDGDLVVCFGYSSDPGALANFHETHRFLRRTRKFLHRRLKFMRHHAHGFLNVFGYAYDQAGYWGDALAFVMAALGRRLEPEVRYDVLCHSMGARAVAAAMERLATLSPGVSTAERFDRIILLAAALADPQVRSLQDTFSELPQNQSPPQVFNITSGFDAVLSVIGSPLSKHVARKIAGDPLPLFPPSMIRGLYQRMRMIGVHGTDAIGAIRWHDIQLDSSETKEWANFFGFDLKGDLPGCWCDHWVHYTHPGNWALYNAILNSKEDWTVDAVRNGSERSGRPEHTGQIEKRSIYELFR